jgi:membrane associated rhomboid family serine protease
MPVPSYLVSTNVAIGHRSMRSHTMQRVRAQNVGYAITPIKPITTTALILANFVVFFYELSLAPLQLDTFFDQWGAVPANISHFQSLPTLVTAMFIHGSLSHIVGNMVALKLFGDTIEDAMGHWGYLLFYLLTGLAATATQVLIEPSSTIPIVGASGAIAGVMGAYLVLFPRRAFRIPFRVGILIRVWEVPAFIVIGLWFVQQLFNGIASLGGDADFTGGVAFWAHVGGFVAGVVLVWLFKDQEAVDRQHAAQETARSASREARGTRTPRPEIPGSRQRTGR